MTEHRKDNMTTNSNYAIQLLLVCILLFGAFHVSYQHDELINGSASHEQGCEYCSSAGSAAALPASGLQLSLLGLISINNTFYEFVRQYSNLYKLQNPRAPPL